MKKIILPLLLLFAGITSNSQSGKKEPPPEPVAEKVVHNAVKEPPPVVIKKELLEDFYKRNLLVEKITRKGSVITLTMKNGTIEKYDMHKKDEDKSFTEKYGVSPIPPSPPPPKKVS